ncbi:MAG: site-specific integrase [Oscillospiraceae bacterium]|nr:site-specific integrase [Oscillospiraceae bacterium]
MTGSLQKKNGKYYAVINTYENGKRKQKWIDTGLAVKGNKTRAEKFLRDEISHYEAISGTVKSDTLLCNYARYWLETRKGKIDIVTYESYEKLLDSDICPYFKESKIKLNDVNVKTVQDYFDYKSKYGRKRDNTGLSASTLKKYKNVLSQVLKCAAKEGYILSNPCQYVELPKAEQYEAKFLTNEQASAMLSAVKGERLYPILLIATCYGMRRSKICGLQWDAIDFLNNTVTVKRTMVKQKTLVIKNSTKTASSHRTYPLLPIIKQELLRIRHEQEDNRRFFGKAYIESNQVFTWDDGHWIIPDYVTVKFQELLRKYNLPIVRLHDLRHSCASIMLSAGMQLKDVQEWLGHSDISMTANVYGHLDDTRKKMVADEISELLTF